ncbi:MAG TPA: hypothetical protein VF787_14045 [Thermoanaerobaculia bacterium]
MTTHQRAGVTIGSLLLATMLTVNCTGGSESKAAGAQTPSREAPTTPEQAVNAKQELATISPAIPIYSGAEFRSDLTRRDEVMVRSRYGNGAEVYTLATDDSFPQVYHYYTTYLAQFRAFDSRDRYPNEGKDWRTLEVQLNQAMQDPFIPGDTMNANGKQVMLQIAETEAEPRTVIRYIVMPVGSVPPVTTVAEGAGLAAVGGTTTAAR